MFDKYNIVHDSERMPFGEHWCGPDQFEPHKETLVATYPKNPPDGDGQSVNVYCTAAPARFYTIRTQAGEDSMGYPQPGFTLSTGSSEQNLAAAIAEAISKGMLGMDK